MKNIYRADLEKAIANLYNTFAKYPLRSQIEGCPCCVTEECSFFKHKELNLIDYRAN